MCAIHPILQSLIFEGCIAQNAYFLDSPPTPVSKKITWHTYANATVTEAAALVAATTKNAPKLGPCNTPKTAKSAHS